MKYQRLIIKVILVLALICATISPALGLELGVNVLPVDLQIMSTEPSGDFNLSLEDAQSIEIVLDRNVTAVWYLDGEAKRTEYNTTTPSYYFTSSTADLFNLTVICLDSFTNASQINFTWFITVEGVAPTPTPPRANRPTGIAEPPVEQLVFEEEPGILTSLWDQAEELDQEDDIDNVIVGLGTLFILLFLFTIKKGGGAIAIAGRREPIKM